MDINLFDNLRYSKEVDVIEQDIRFGIFASENDHVGSIVWSRVRRWTVTRILSNALLDVRQH